MAAEVANRGPVDILDGWKQIAEHLGKTERTVQRWEKSKGLPVRRLQADSPEEQPRVFAYKSEINAWWEDHQSLKEAGEEEPEPGPRSWRRLRVIPIAIVVAFTAVAVLYFLPTNKTLGVVPIRNLTPVGDAVAEQAAEGLTEEILTAMGRLQPRRFSVVQLPPESSALSLEQLVKTYHLDYVIKGSVQRAGNKVAITAQLIRAKDQSPIWGNSYQRDLGSTQDIIPIEIEVTRDIIAGVLPLLPRDPHPPQQVNPDAYQAYLWGRLLWNRRTADSLYQAIPFFQKSIDLDPIYAPAHAGLADCYFLLGSVPYTALPPNEAFPKAEAAARRALELDGRLAAAHVSLGYSALVYRRNFIEAEKEFQSALKLSPEDPTAHEFYAYYLTAMGRLDEAINERKIARDLDPLSPLLNTALGEAYYEARQFKQAIQEHRKALLADPAFADALMNLARTYEQLGMYQQADAIIQPALAAYPNEPAILAIAGHEYAVSGRPRQARAMIDRLEQLKANNTYVSPVYFALIHIGLGENDHAFAALDQAYEEGSEYLVYLGSDPWADPLRRDPRFPALLKKLGIPKNSTLATAGPH